MPVSCPSCGAQNDSASRFCDQCGAALAPAQASAGGAPAAAVATCPNCGAAVLPGEAFCDECGTELKTEAVPAAALPVADAPTVIAGSTSAAPASASGVCPICGHHNLPGDRFCDQCGVDLEAAPAGAEAAPAVLEPAETPLVPAAGSGQAPPSTAVDAPTELAAPVSSGDATVASATEPVTTSPVDPSNMPTILASTPGASVGDGQGAEAAAPVEAPVDASPAEASAASPAAPVAAESTPAEQPAPAVIEPADELPATAESTAAVPTTAAQQTYDAERQRLEEVIATQQRLIGQFEQMLATFGTAAPPAVSQGLNEARSTLADAEAQLSALVPPPPPVDPAELKRLEDEIALQQRLIGQFEQMLATFGAAAPPAVSQGLGDARTALAEAEAQLASLTGGTTLPAGSGPVPIAPPTQATAASETVPAPEATTAAAPATEATTAAMQPVTEAAPAPAAAPAPRPRLVMEEGGVELPLDPDRHVFIIGREDPISGIHPEIDLTPYGGESGGVSRQHARIERDGDQWTVTDLDSTNYTRLNGTRLDPNVATPLADGTRVQFGRLVSVFKLS